MIVEIEYSESWRNLGQVSRLEIYLSDLKFLSVARDGESRQRRPQVGEVRSWTVIIQEMLMLLVKFRTNEGWQKVDSVASFLSLLG